MQFVCDYCGKIFERKNNHKKSKHHFCDKYCHGKWTSKYMVGDKAGHYKNALKVSICIQCKKQFQFYGNTRDKKYCSRECKWEHMRKRIVVKCDYCDKDISIQPNRLKLSKFRGRGKIYCDKNCHDAGQRGSNNPGWIKDRTKLSDHRHSERESMQYKEWRKTIFERDDYTCQDCGRRGGTILHAHHIKEWEHFPELRYDLDNGKTVCRSCHRKYHLARYSNRKLSEIDIVEIKRLRCEDGLTLDAIAKIFSVSQGTISIIARGLARTNKLVNKEFVK